MNEYGEEIPMKIYDSVKDACSYDGKIYAYPMVLEMLGVYYNQELFEKAGITEVPKTFSQMKEVERRYGVSDLGRRALVQRQRHPLYPLLLLRGPRSGRFHRPQYLRSGERF